VGHLLPLRVGFRLILHVHNQWLPGYPSISGRTHSWEHQGFRLSLNAGRFRMASESRSRSRPTQCSPSSFKCSSATESQAIIRFLGESEGEASDIQWRETSRCSSISSIQESHSWDLAVDARIEGSLRVPCSIEGQSLGLGPHRYRPLYVTTTSQTTEGSGYGAKTGSSHGNSEIRV